MRIIGYILLGLLLLGISLAAWYFLIYLKVPAINIPEGITDSEKMKIIDQWFSDLQKANKMDY